MLLIYFIGLIITFIWAKSAIRSGDAFLPALIFSVLWPISVPLKMLFKFGIIK